MGFYAGCRGKNRCRAGTGKTAGDIPGTRPAFSLFPPHDFPKKNECYARREIVL